jgi:hypothetical protein
MRLLVFALTFGIATTLLGQAPQPGPSAQTTQPGQPAPGQPARTPARPLRPGETPPKGTAVIRGYVTAQATGSPVRRAQVRVSSSDGRGSSGVTSTDNEGRFEVKELVAGRYVVMATKGGFVTAQFGQRRPNEPGTPIELADGQTAEKVSFSLMRGGVIAGRILDDGGEPVSGAQVMAMRYGFSAGTRRMIPAGSEGGNDRTDDQGAFRMFGLPPGDYFVSAVSRINTLMSADTNNTEADGLAPTYFPGTANLAEASRITLRAGQEMTGANFAMIVARLAKVRGRALNSSGEPVTSSMLMLSPADPAGMSMAFNNTIVGRDGAFQFTNVAPGRYNLTVRPNSMPNSGGEFASMPIVVGSEDLDNLSITTSLGVTARGVIVTDDGSAPAFKPSQVTVIANPAEPMTMMFGNTPSKVNDDYSFEISGLSDRRLLRVSAGPAWFLKAVFHGGDDVTDTGVDFVPGRSVEDLQIVVTQKTTELSGLVTDDRNRPVVDSTVVIFPANRERWGYLSRYLRTVRPDTEGRYNVKSLPPGEDYLIIAVQNLESGQGGDPEFLARAREEAKPLTLNEGETKAVDVKLSKLVP